MALQRGLRNWRKHTIKNDFGFKFSAWVGFYKKMVVVWWADGDTVYYRKFERKDGKDFETSEYTFVSPSQFVFFGVFDDEGGGWVCYFIFSPTGGLLVEHINPNFERTIETQPATNNPNYPLEGGWSLNHLIDDLGKVSFTYTTQDFSVMDEEGDNVGIKLVRVKGGKCDLATYNIPAIIEGYLGVDLWFELDEKEDFLVMPVPHQGEIGFYKVHSETGQTTLLMTI